ncbi:MAG: glycosyltransferase family 2 protein [Deltaproteobacteria bacterium]|nr:glycosyltransferase family 2 protein [Deltaproteobacteria bacterium]
MDVSILIATYNSERYIVPCFDSINKFCAGIKYEIIVVDNASIDGTVDLIRNRYPHVQLIENQSNVGFGAANNQAALMAQGEYLFLLNADTELLDDGITRALSYARESKAGVLGPRTFDAEGVQLRTCDKVNSVSRQIRVYLSMAFYLGHLRSFFTSGGSSVTVETTYDQPEDVSFIVGSAMLIDRSAYERYSLFDEEFFFTGEERDLCLRYRKAGLNLVYFPDWSILHYIGSQTPHSCFHISSWIKSSLIFARNYGAVMERFFMRLSIFLFLASYCGAFIVKSIIGRSKDEMRCRARDYVRILFWYIGLISEQRLLAKGNQESANHNRTCHNSPSA